MKRIMPFVGALQVQVQNSMFYLSLMNATLLALTFWSTTGTGLMSERVPWMGTIEFFGFVVLLLIIIMLLDYKVMYPHRQAFLSKQSYIHKNPAVYDLQKLIKDMARVKEALGITDEEEEGTTQ